MEVSIFPTVRAELARFVEVRLHTDDETHGEKFQALQKRLVGHLSLPTFVVVDPEHPDVVLDRMSGADLIGDRFRAFLARNAGAKSKG